MIFKKTYKNWTILKKKFLKTVVLGYCITKINSISSTKVYKPPCFQNSILVKPHFAQPLNTRQPQNNFGEI